MTGGDGDRFVMLGSKGGPAIRPIPGTSGGPWPTSHLLQLNGQTIIVDCGLGVARGVVAAGIELPAIDAVFITHLHSDHVLELGPLLHTAWTAGLNRSVRVFGPIGIGSYWRAFLQSMAFDVTIRINDEGRPALGSLVEVVEFDEGSIVELGSVGVLALRVSHPPVDDCFALRFDGTSRSVVFSADTAYFPPLADLARGVDLLVHEAMLVDGVESLIGRTPNADRLREHLYASHATAAEAARIAASANVGHLVLGHLIPADDPAFGEDDWRAAVTPHFSGLLTIGSDGLVIPLN